MSLMFYMESSPLSPPPIIEDEFTDVDFKVKLYKGNQKLLIYEKKIIWLAGGLMIRQINLENVIIDCFFTTFADENLNNKSISTFESKQSSGNVLVIVLEDQIRVYDQSKSVSIVSFPIHIHNAFPFHRGMIIGKKIEVNCFPLDIFSNSFKISSPNDPLNSIQGSPISAPYSTPFSFNNYTNIPSSAAYNESNFLTLTDPVGDLGTVVSSSTTSFSQKEELVLYPEFTSSSLAATYNSVDQNILIYYTRYLSKPKTTPAKSFSGSQSSKKSNKRSVSSSGMMNTSMRILEDEQKHFRSSSNPLSYDRMASGTEHASDTVGSTSGMVSHSSMESWSLRKDVIFTKISSVSFKYDKSALKIFNLSCNDKDVIVVVNLEVNMINIYIFEKSSNKISIPKFKNSISINGLDAAKFDMGETSSNYILLLKNNHEIVLFNPFYEILSPTINLFEKCPPIKLIDDINNFEVSFLCEDRKHYTLYLQTQIKNRYVQTFITSLKYLSHDLIYENFWLHWCANLSLDIPYCDEWKLYVVTLLSLCFPDNINLTHIDTSLNEITKLLPYVEKARMLRHSRITGVNVTADLSLESLLPKIVLSLHVIREDLKLNISSKFQYDRLSIFLSQMIYWMSWSKPWQIYYPINETCIDKSLQLSLAEYISKPPDIMESLGSLFSGQLVSYITFSIIAGEEDSVDKLITLRTYNILRLFEVIISSEFDNLDLIRTMVSLDIDALEIETYPPGIFFIFKNTIELCQRKLKSNWNVTVPELKLIGRNDLLHLDSIRHDEISFNNSKYNVSSKTMDEILSQLSSNEVLNAWDSQAEADKFHVTRLIFSQDRRFYELTKLLQTSKIQKVTFEPESNLDDYEKLIQQHVISAKIALRTLTTPIGRGAVFNSSRKPLVTEGFPIPKMNFNTLILPENINLTLDNGVISKYLLDWGYFHNGASAGLSVSKEFEGISGSWVVFNRPPVLNAQHAGFLLGLGLNGHLKHLEEWHIYNYLGPKHVYTSIGLLIGMAASLRGTMDIKITKVLSVHVVAFLPPGSTNLNVQLPVQTAGIIGIGLVYLETQHRRMSEVLLAQISSALIINDKKIVSEGYQLAAGFALGYINLGKGDDMISSQDSHIIDNLISFGTSIRDVQTLKELDKSCSGAVMALTFMFLKTGNQEIADKLSLPKTIQLLEYVRPDLLMLRSLAKNMVMWNEIEPTKEFVHTQIPTCISKRYSIESISSLDTGILPYINVLSGELLSISICFASTANLEAKKTLLYYLDLLLNLSFIEPQKYDSKVALIGVRNARDIVILGLSIVMAGTGDLDVMRRLRYLQGITDEYTKYGNYMAINMSLGFLFLGGGQQAFNINDNFSIAALITSIYPMFGSNNYEELGDVEGKSANEINDLHSQALRHFWALAVIDRCLVVREVDSEKPVKVDVEVLLKNKTSFKVPSPCLLPDLSLIHKISVNSKNIYFPVEFDLIRSSNAANTNFKKRLNLYVDKKSSYKTLKLDFMEMVEMDENNDNNNNKTFSNIDSLKRLKIFENLENFEKDILFDSIKEKSDPCSLTSTVFDFKYEIEKIVKDEEMLDNDKIMNLKLIFNFVDNFTLLNDDKEVSKRNKRKNKKFLGINNDNNLDNFFNLDDKYESFTQTDISKGLNYLNIEVIEKLKKVLFSRKE